jgi:outer membrane lipase/esterase
VQAPELRAQVKTMVEAFNAALKAGLDAEPAVVQVDVYALTVDEAVNPTVYGLTNVTAPACGPNALNGHSLLCNVGNVYPGVDISHFLYADTVHPTPYGHALMARQVLHEMAIKGWL